MFFFFFFQAEDGIRDYKVTGVQTCALPISKSSSTGAMILQGPHQSAYPSMTTGTSVPLRTASSVASVTAMGRSSRIGRPQLPHLGRSVMRVRSTRLSVPQNGQTTVARLLTSVTDTAHLHRESTCLVARSLPPRFPRARSEEHTSELQSPCNLVCR